MTDSEITSNRCNHIIWLCNRSLDGDDLQLQNGGRHSDVAQCILALIELVVSFHIPPFVSLICRQWFLIVDETADK